MSTSFTTPSCIRTVTGLARGERTILPFWTPGRTRGSVGLAIERYDNLRWLGSDGCPPFPLWIESNTVTQEHHPVRMAQFGRTLDPMDRSTLEVHITDIPSDCSNRRIVVRNTRLTAGTHAPGNLEFMQGANIGNMLPGTVVADNRILGYHSSVEGGIRSNNSTVSFSRNLITEEQSSLGVAG